MVFIKVYLNKILKHKTEDENEILPATDSYLPLK